MNLNQQNMFWSTNIMLEKLIPSFTKFTDIVSGFVLNRVEQTGLVLVKKNKCHQPLSLPPFSFPSLSRGLTIQISSGPGVSVNINKPVAAGSINKSLELHYTSPLHPLPSQGSHALHPRALCPTLFEYSIVVSFTHTQTPLSATVRYWFSLLHLRVNSSFEIRVLLSHSC